MNIKQRRLELIIEKILREELQKGNLPTSREFIERIRGYLEREELHKPSLQVRVVRKGATAYAEDLNQSVAQSYEDLDILYKSITDKYDVLLKNFNKFDVEKVKLDYELNKLESHLKELALLYSQSGFLTSVYDVFDDLSKVDTTKSTTEVDIKSHQTTLAWSKNLSMKLPTNGLNATFSLEAATKNNILSRKTIGNIPYSLSENIDEVWAEVLYTKQGDAKVEGIYEVNFGETALFNNIEVDPHAGSGVYLNFQYSADGVTWKDLPISEEQGLVEGPVSYSFNYLSIRKIRIRMTKQEADHSNVIKEQNKQSLVYGYILGIKKISFAQIGYADKGELYSKALSPITKENAPFTISKVSLYADEVIPNGTTIEYFVAMEPEESTEPEWKAISPVNREAPKHDQIIDFKNISAAPAHTYVIDPTISIGESRLESLYANGIDFYRLGDIEGRQLIEGTEQLYVGKDSWGIKAYEYTKAAGHVPGLIDWEKPENMVTENFSKITDGKNGSLLEEQRFTKHTNLLFTLGLFSRKEEVTISAVPVSSEPITIYVNGLKVFEGIPSPSTRINYLFKTGWNEIKIAAYITNTINQATGTTISIGFDPREYASYTYAQSRSLEKVSLFDLRYNVKSNDHNKYAIMETNGRYTIVLNRIVPGLEYDFYSEYVDGDPKNTILFKAIMTMDRNVCYISPKLKSYRLRFS